uniref:Protease 3 n=1 Tax=Candidatus Kentrum eta TaxID=2126337 RepID=A0A450UBA3_9GAMM|nr:MAG: Secreted Zn-dependent peptidases, insulinase-like [Candidatus Kentron sp. H]VFJ89519.1 MAG: Secreted Zn-dependent peptidases, insulinase-like [Candidatus Kentron sp. H]VFJ96210.1 MAG: Secreted Zn-dependent peptidases, insulinase-like [Candidatus Kentron sp. H]
MRSIIPPGKTTRPLLLAVCLALLGLLPSPARCDAAIVAPPHDTRQYAAFELPNRLKVLAISDPETDKAACALDVFLGTRADPPGRPGLAHFLEHMLFLGTRKYPEPDAWRAFITEHAGEQNAYTGFEHTNYYFDVDKDHLRAALDRFGQFFIAPSFAPAYVARERLAVDAEFHAKRQEDAWRERAIARQVMNPRHPLSRFSIGNLATLADGATNGRETDVREDLIAFYRRHYSANRMALVVLGKEPVAVLEAWVRGVFSAIPDRQAAPLPITEPLFAPGRLPVRVTARPVKERRRLELSFPVPPVTAHWRTKPLYYIAHGLGHEGQGSLLSLLKARGWAEELKAGTRDSHRDSALFTVAITLTEEGLAAVDAVTDLTFEAIALIRAQGVREWLFRELSQLGNMDFLFREELPPLDEVSALAGLLHDYPAREILRGPMTVDEYDEGLIRAYLAALRPDNVLMMVTDPKCCARQRPSTIPPGEACGMSKVAKPRAHHPHPQREDGHAALCPSYGSRTPWFQAPYRVTAIEPALMEEWRSDRIPEQPCAAPVPSAIDTSPGDRQQPVGSHADRNRRSLPCAALAIPGPNPFIPQDLALKPAPDHPQDRPVRLMDSPGLTVWFQQDTGYRLPRANFYLSVRSPVANDTPTHAVLTDLLVALVEDRLTEFAYPASLAGLEYEIYSHMRGLTLRMEGYHDKQPRLLAGILEALRQPKLDEERFRIARLELIRKLRNRRKQVPYRRSLAELGDLLLRPRWTPEALLGVLEPGVADNPPDDRRQTTASSPEGHRRTLPRAAPPCAAPVTLEDLRAFIPEFFRRLSLVALSHGNVRETDARAMANLVKDRLLRDARPTHVPRGQVVRLGSGAAYPRRIAPAHPDAALLLYLQGTDRGFPERARMALLGQILKGAFFNRLRTEEQLGYVVSAGAYPLLEVPGLVFLVQSPHTGPAALGARVERFLTEQADVLDAMTDSEFARHKAALMARILEQEESLPVRSHRYWGEIDQGLSTFDSRERKAEAVRALTLAGIRRAYRTRITGPARRRLVVHARGNRQGESHGGYPKGDGDEAPEEGLADEAWVRMESPEGFKRGQVFFPGEDNGAPVPASPPG